MRQPLNRAGCRVGGLVILALALTWYGAGCADSDGTRQRATEYDVVVSEPRFVVPSAGLPPEVDVRSSNNNVDIIEYGGRLYMGWRTAPNHFASTETRLYIVSSGDGGVRWDFEHVVHLGSDMREPRFLALAGYLQLMFFQGGTDPGGFEPVRLWRTRQLGRGQWSELEVLTDAGEVPWDVRVRGDRAYRTSYQGQHYGAGETSEVYVYFRESTDGTTWTDVGGKPFVYFGGVSEVAFEFDVDGSLYMVTRNEDGDESGFGSHVCYAPPDALADWQCPPVTDPDRYDSPEMFRHENDIYLVARRDIGGPYDARDEDLTLAERRSRYLIAYSLRPKRTALYKIDKQARRVVHVMDLPGVGDTCFPALIQTGPHTFLLANYTSPLDDPDVTWLRGQTSSRGTQIYLATIEFVPYTGPPRTPTATPTATVRPTATPIGGDNPLRVDVSPVFAAPGAPLQIAWPDRSDLGGKILLGDDNSVAPSDSEHVYAGSGIFTITEDLVYAGQPVEFTGTVARTDVRAFTALNGFKLTEPNEPVVEMVIRGLVPAFYWAFADERLAFASDPTGQRRFGFHNVVAVDVAAEPDGSFATPPFEFAIELSGPDATGTGLFVRLVGSTFSGRVDGQALVSPMRLDGRLVLEDIVEVAIVLAGLDEQGALEFLAGLLNFDPRNPPESVPFKGEFTLQPE